MAIVRQVRKYTKEFQLEAVNLALKSPSISSTATELGIPTGTLHTWIKNLKGKAPQYLLNRVYKIGARSLIDITPIRR
jgi:transposase-like protein